MALLQSLYGTSLALLTDLYQLTMAAAAFDSGLTGREAAFTLSFRKHPFEGGYTVAAGLDTALEYIELFRFSEEDLAYLAGLRDDLGAPLLKPGFLEFLRDLRLDVDVDAVPEGTPVFPYEPLVRVRGPIVPCMLLETPLLAIVNFQTLVATKAARICQAAQGEPVLEFGLRRAQGVDGSITAARAAYVGGCAATSNVLAGRLLGIPARGTHAHSWVMLIGDELEAFKAYARSMPGNCTLLVDTFDSLAGVRHAIEVGLWLREHGGRLAGVRLDSGDLAWLSQEARRMLDAAGLRDTAIVATNELDERIIESLKDQDAKANVWGVGTRLVTGAPDAALGGVYKLGAVRSPGGAWEHRVKVSEQTAKASIPGWLQVRRFQRGDEVVADMIWDELLGAPPERPLIVDPLDLTRRREVLPQESGVDLLVPAVRSGRVVAERPPLDAIRQRTGAELARFHPGVRRFVNPHRFPVGLERGLFDARTRLILEARGLAEDAGAS
ncbi:MAG TPA: nicotinate phosphoribosyltransferase [Anaeromyxobacteraceae bacterium]|nr:nicotinate phosphoribosyltransferase [Anaeromyxobacteraceae bacterium]